MLGSMMSVILANKGFYVLAAYSSNKEFVPSGENIEKVNFDITEKIHLSWLKNIHPVRSLARAKGTSPKDLGEATSYGIHTIIHCAAVTDVNFCELNKPFCRKVNVGGTENLVNLARSLDAQFIYISTPMVFSGKKGNYNEKDKTNPINYYGKTKNRAEKIVLKYKNGLVLRANPIGRRPLGAHPSFVQWFFDMALNNRSFSLFTDVVINPISTKTLSNIVIDIISGFKPGILHLGSRDRINKAEIWEEIVKLFPDYSGVITRLSVNKTHAGKIAFRPHEMWLNVDKAANLGYFVPNWKDEVQIVLAEILNKK